MLRNKGAYISQNIKGFLSNGIFGPISDFVFFQAFGASDDDLEYFVSNGGS